MHPTQQSNPPQSQSTHLTVPGCLQPGLVREDVMEVAEATLVVEGGISAMRSYSAQVTRKYESRVQRTAKCLGGS